MTHFRRTFLLAAASLPLTGCVYFDLGVGGLGHYSRDFHFTYPLDSSGHVSVEGFNGGVEITSWNQGEVDLDGTKYAPSQSEADALQISVDHTSSAISIRAVRPSDRRGNYGVRFVLKVPRGAIIDRVATSNGPIHLADGAGPSRLKTSNSAVRVENFRGDLDIQTSNGPVELDDVEGAITAHTSNSPIRAQAIKGSLDAETSNSPITAVLQRAARETRLSTRNSPIDLALPSGFATGVRASTSNSPITIRLAEPANARVSAHTSNGSVTSEFDATMHGEISRNSFDGTIGSGGALLDLSSSNGAIRIVRQ